MMDDNLSDTQQENKMSVKELKFNYLNKVMEVERLGEGIEIDIKGNKHEWIVLDRSQAHLLMLYLQEHLNAK